MRRFNYEDNEEHREDVDKFFSESNLSEEDLQNLTNFAEQELAQQEWQVKLADRDFNMRILRTAIRICEKSWLWNFYPYKTKMSMILDALDTLKFATDE